jgi:hypothetical protein
VFFNKKYFFHMPGSWKDQISHLDIFVLLSKNNNLTLGFLNFLTSAYPVDN